MPSSGHRRPDMTDLTPRITISSGDGPCHRRRQQQAPMRQLQEQMRRRPAHHGLKKYLRPWPIGMSLFRMLAFPLWLRKALRVRIQPTWCLCHRCLVILATALRLSPWPPSRNIGGAQAALASCVRICWHVVLFSKKQEINPRSLFSVLRAAPSRLLADMERMARTVFVDHIPSSRTATGTELTEEMLLELFSQCGRPQHAKLRLVEDDPDLGEAGKNRSWAVVHLILRERNCAARSWRRNLPLLHRIT
eukprot:SAG31_NODE_332_length_17516_cov_3.552840_18_plen_249_part_00